MKLDLISEHGCFGGSQRFYSHQSRECRTEMRFSVYVPPQAQQGEVPVLYYLAGLTCTEETFMIKAGAQRVAAELGLMLVSPDTSPRKARIPGDDDNWDFGLGASFYVDATQAPWSDHYRMYSYVTRELPELVRHGHVFLAQPPLYRLTQGPKSVYAMDDAERERKIKAEFKPGAKVEVSRFKGLGEMPPASLKETTMDPKRRTLLQVVLPPEMRAETSNLVETLMGRKPELRFKFIQDNAAKLDQEAVDA